MKKAISKYDTRKKTFYYGSVKREAYRGQRCSWHLFIWQVTHPSCRQEDKGRKSIDNASPWHRFPCLEDASSLCRASRHLHGQRYHGHQLRATLQDLFPRYRNQDIVADGSRRNEIALRDNNADWRGWPWVVELPPTGQGHGLHEVLELLAAHGQGGLCPANGAGTESWRTSPSDMLITRMSTTTWWRRNEQHLNDIIKTKTSSFGAKMAQMHWNLISNPHFFAKTCLILVYYHYLCTVFISNDNRANMIKTWTRQ